MTPDPADLVITEVMTKALEGMLSEPTPDQTFLNLLFMQGYEHTAPGTYTRKTDEGISTYYHVGQGRFECVETFWPKVLEVTIKLDPITFTL